MQDSLKARIKELWNDSTNAHASPVSKPADGNE